MRTVCVRLRRGDDLLLSLRALAQREGLRAAVILSGVGCVTEAQVRDASGVTVRHIAEPCEITALQGTVSDQRCHVHIALSREDMTTLGGHLNAYQHHLRAGAAGAGRLAVRRGAGRGHGL